MTSEEAVRAFCMLSARFSRGFPEKGMAWCCVHYSCVKVFTVLVPWYSGLGLLQTLGSEPETGASASPERLFRPPFWPAVGLQLGRLRGSPEARPGGSACH